MRLNYLRDTFPDSPLIACTATATSKVIDDIKQELRLTTSPCFIGSFDRPNIFYKVAYKDTIDATKIGGVAADLVRFIQKQHRRCEQENVKCSGIIYCHTRSDTVELASSIRKDTGLIAVAYHGGMKADERIKVQNAWSTGDAQIAVATVAFGMGYVLISRRN